MFFKISSLTLEQMKFVSQGPKLGENFVAKTKKSPLTMNVAT